MKPASDGLGKRLIQARLYRDLTMDQLADKAKVTQQTISRLELGKNYPVTITVEKLANALEVDPCWLLFGTGTVPDWATKDDPKDQPQRD